MTDMKSRIIYPNLSSLIFSFISNRTRLMHVQLSTIGTHKHATFYSHEPTM